MEKYFEQIKNATSKAELQEISFNFCKNEPYQALSKESNLIDGLCVYKECLLDNANKSELEQCIKVLKLPKTIVKKIS